MRTIEGKRVLITGAAGGIGLAIAKRLAGEGARLALLDKSDAELDTIDPTVFHPDCDLFWLPCDLRESDQIADVVCRVAAEWGGLDILVNNAGIAYYGGTAAMTAEQSNGILQVNLTGPVELTHLFLPYLLAQPEAQIVNISSMYSYVATNRSTIYHTTKYGLLGFSEALRAEYARSNLGVTAICPGFVNTGLLASLDCGKGRGFNAPSWLCTTPEKVARQTVRAIYKNRRMVLCGWLAHATYLVRCAAPGLFDSLYHIRSPRLLKRKKPKAVTYPASEPIRT